MQDSLGPKRLNDNHAGDETKGHHSYIAGKVAAIDQVHADGGRGRYNRGPYGVSLLKRAVSVIKFNERTARTAVSGRIGRCFW